MVAAGSPRALGRPGAVGILGGSFDPPHLGHLAAARSALEQLGLDRVLLIVANDPWQKSPHRDLAPAADRLAMVMAAVEGAAGLEACDLEVERGGPTYSIETVEQLRAEQGVVDPWLIVGADLAGSLDSWHRADELRRVVRVAVLSRPGSRGRLPEGWDAVLLESEDLDISSSEIRQDLRAGRSVADRVPDGVIRYLDGRNLYA